MKNTGNPDYGFDVREVLVVFPVGHRLAGYSHLVRKSLLCEAFFFGTGPVIIPYNKSLVLFIKRKKFCWLIHPLINESFIGKEIRRNQFSYFLGNCNFS